MNTHWHYCTKFLWSDCSICIIYADIRENHSFRSEGNISLISGFYEEKINILSIFVTVQSNKFGVPEDYLTKLLVYI